MQLKILLFFYLSLYHRVVDTILSIKKYVVQNEMSEFCKRRVIPSLFLGKNVKDGNLNVLHFSRLDIPYSCMMAIRTESGNNILLVIKLLTENMLRNACKKHPNQLVVYELGETFGGYWAPVPEEIIAQPQQNYTKYYTLKTTQSLSTQSEEDIGNISSVTPSTTTAQAEEQETEREYMRVELPLVNISGNVQMPNWSSLRGNSEELDDKYDVMPRNGVEYITSIMPLVELSIKQQTRPDGQELVRNNELLYELRYKLDDEDDFTLDPRLTFSTAHRKYSTKKTNWWSTRHLRFKHRMNKLFSRKSTLVEPQRSHTVKTLEEILSYQRRADDVRSPDDPSTTPDDSGTTPDGEGTTADDSDTTPDDPGTTLNDPGTTPDDPDTMPDDPSTTLATDYWYLIDDIIKSYKMSSSSARTEKASAASLLDRIANIREPNISAYLSPNLSLYDGHIDNDLFGHRTDSSQPTLNISFSHSNPKTTASTTYISSVETYTSNTTLEHRNSTQRNPVNSYTNGAGHLDPYIVPVNTNSSKRYKSDILKTTTDKNWTSIINKTISTPYKGIRTPITGSLVDHESWENIVRVAPAMATVLNKTNNNEKDHEEVRLAETLDTFSNRSEVRRKRYIAPLNLEKSRPRHLTTKKPIAVVTETSYILSDLQYLAPMLEIQDDEIEGRIALRYLSKYVGSMLFNICDHEQRQFHRVQILNSSRIAIAISNFTLEHLMLILTPAVVLVNNKTCCSHASLECQIMGTRVCIDSINACDGVPNCGTNDIYDEDRNLCGVVGSGQYVFFAAFAFIGVIFTFVYTVRYCFIRCVPRVSEAFFIYSDDAENTLYLDSIMRSPREDDDSGSLSKFYPAGQFDEKDLSCLDIRKEPDKSKTKKYLQYILKYLLRRKAGKDAKITHPDLLSQKSRLPEKFSFTEFELKKMIRHRDVLTQTGNSIEMKPINIKENINATKSKDSFNISSDANRTYGLDSYVSELSLINTFNNKRTSTSSDSSLEKINPKEKIKRQVVDTSVETELHSTVYDDSLIPSGSRPRQKRRLKVPLDDDSIEKHLRFTENPTFIPATDGEDSDVTSSKINVMKPSGSRDFRNYWSSSKKRKSKKTAKMSLT